MLLLFTTAAVAEEEARTYTAPRQPGVSGSNLRTDQIVVEEGGNSLFGRWAEKWPEDLVVAPIPNREPVFGWGLQLLAGYFMDLDKDNPDATPSRIGAVGLADDE